MKAFEYLHEMKTCDKQDFNQLLTEYGKAGWDIIHIIQLHKAHEFYTIELIAKRPRVK